MAERGGGASRRVSPVSPYGGNDLARGQNPRRRSRSRLAALLHPLGADQAGATARLEMASGTRIFAGGQRDRGEINSGDYRNQFTGFHAASR